MDAETVGGLIVILLCIMLFNELMRPVKKKPTGGKKMVMT
jgi:hypothetical protein